MKHYKTHEAECLDHYKAKAYRQAVASFTAALATPYDDRQRRVTYLYRGLAHQRNDDLTAALADFDLAVIEDDAATKPAFHMFRFVARRLAKADVASDFARLWGWCFDDWRKVDAKFTFGWNTLYRDAVDDLDRVPVDWRGLFVQGLVKRRLDDWPGAIADYQRAAELAPDEWRLAEWAATAGLLRHGIPRGNSPREAMPGIEYCRVFIAGNTWTAYDFDENGVQTRSGEVDSRDDLPAFISGEGWRILDHGRGYPDREMLLFWRYSGST